MVAGGVCQGTGREEPSAQGPVTASAAGVAEQHPVHGQRRDRDQTPLVHDCRGIVLHPPHGAVHQEQVLFHTSIDLLSLFLLPDSYSIIPKRSSAGRPLISCEADGAITIINSNLTQRDPTLLLYSSFVEMERHPDLYMLVFQALQVVAECEVLQPLLLPLEAQPVSLAELTETQLGRKLDIFLRQSAKERKGGLGVGKLPVTAPAAATTTATTTAAATTATTATNLNPTATTAIAPAATTAASSSSSSSSSSSDAALDADANGDSGDALMKFIQQVVEKVRSVAAAANTAKSSSSSGLGTVVDLTGDDSAAGAVTSTAMDVVQEGSASSSASSGSAGGIKTAGGSSSSSSSSLSAEAEYALAMSPLQYAETDSLSGYYYVEELKKDNMGATVKSRIKRLGQEHMDLSNSLPLSLSSSVWLRASAERMDALQVVPTSNFNLRTLDSPATYLSIT